MDNTRGGRVDVDKAGRVFQSHQYVHDPMSSSFLYNEIHSTTDQQFGQYTSFGQLLSQATNGALYQYNFTEQAYPQQNNYCETQYCRGGYEAGDDEGYEAGYQEQNDDQTYPQEEDYEGYEAGDDSEEQENLNEPYDFGNVDSEYEAADESEYIEETDIGSQPQTPSEQTPMTDDLPDDRFTQKTTWIGSDYEEMPRGVDDTAMDTEDDVHAVEDVTSIDEPDSVNDGVEILGSTEQNSECLLGSGGCGCASDELAQEISEQYTESLKAGYQKRNRKKVSEYIPDCRAPRAMGALEIALRLSKKRKTEHIFEPILGMVFDSADEGYEFYNMYSWESGFGIVKNKCRRRQSEQDFRSMQELCCERSGQDRRVARSTKKIKCKAKMKMLRGHDGGWYVSEFIKQHNHPMALTCSEKRDWFSHKRLDPHTLRTIKYLRDNNVSQTEVRCIIGSMFGSLKGAPCTKRSIRTICNQISRERMDGDVAKTMELFRQLKSNDPEFQWSVETVKDSRINTLMWCSGKSRQQYACFGDVVTFDTTYCTNFYKMPFGLFVGVNNHFQTIVFGGVLMRSETTESFEWVFNEFIKLMGGKPPKTVLTDQCKAMTIALARVWPETFHLWCKWHVMKNIRESLGPTYTKNAQFREEFYAIVNEMLSKEEFDCAWNDLCTRYKLTDNPFMIRTFQCRCKWAKPWSKGNFCAGMTSTQRSESANWMLKRFVPRNSSMCHFVSQFNLLLEDREMEEGREENMTKQLFVKYSRLWPVERHAIKVYTRQSLKLFRKQVDLASNFKVTAQGPSFYVVERNRKAGYPEWRKKTYKVHVFDGGARYYCECGFFEHIGILCCHTLRVMIRTEVQEIPKVHILTRWTRNAKDVIPEHMRFEGAKKKDTGTLDIWQRRMNTRALEACTKGNTYRETYDIVMRHLNQAIHEVDEFIAQKKEEEEIEAAAAAEEVDNVTDLDVEIVNRNRYGAAGSSAGLSDAEIQNLRPPEVQRGRGRMRTKRFMSEAEKGSRRTAKKPCAREKQATKKKTSKPTTLDEFGEAHRDNGLPYQTSFCTKCRKPGHTRNRCASQTIGPGNGKNKVNCTKCGLDGHNEVECLVVDLESSGYFR